MLNTENQLADGIVSSISNVLIHCISNLHYWMQDVRCTKGLEPERFSFIVKRENYFKRLLE